MSMTKAQLEEKNRELRATVVELEAKVSKLENAKRKLTEANSALEDGIKLAHASANAANADANELRGRVHMLEAELLKKNAALADAYMVEKAGEKPAETATPAPAPKAPAAKKQPEETGGIKKSPEPMRLPFGAPIPVPPAPKAPEEKPAPAPAPAKAAEPVDSEKDARRAKLSPRFRALLEEQEKKPPVQCPITDEQFLQAATLAAPAPAPVLQDLPDPKLPSFFQPVEGEEDEEDDGEIGYPSDDDLEDEISEENGAPYGISPTGEFLDPDEAQ